MSQNIKDEDKNNDIDSNEIISKKCSICLENKINNVYMDCIYEHAYCFDCILKWLFNNKVNKYEMMIINDNLCLVEKYKYTNDSCPLCRGSNGGIIIKYIDRIHHIDFFNKLKLLINCNCKEDDCEKDCTICYGFKYKIDNICYIPYNILQLYFENSVYEPEPIQESESISESESIPELEEIQLEIHFEENEPVIEPIIEPIIESIVEPISLLTGFLIKLTRYKKSIKFIEKSFLGTNVPNEIIEISILVMLLFNKFLFKNEFIKFEMSTIIDLYIFISLSKYLYLFQNIYPFIYNNIPIIFKTFFNIFRSIFF